MAPMTLSLELLSSDTIYEREVLKLDHDDTETELNSRVIQSAIDAGVPDFDIARCIGSAIVPLPASSASSSIMIAPPLPHTSRSSLTTVSTAPLSTLSITSSRPSMTRATHRKNTSISSLFTAENDTPPSSFERLPDPPHHVRRVKSSLKLRLKGLSSLKKDNASSAHLPHVRSDSRADSHLDSRSVSRAGSRSDSPDPKHLVSNHSGLRTMLVGKFTTKDITHSSETQNMNGAWPSTGVNTSVSMLVPPTTHPAAIQQHQHHDDSHLALQAMLTPPPLFLDKPRPLHREMKAAMTGRQYIFVQAMNRGELRRLKAFGDRQLMGLAALHELERRKMLSVFDQQEELINAKYRQAMSHLNEDHSLLAELDLLAALDDRLRREQTRLRHMEAYCSPESGRVLTAQNLQMLQRQRDAVQQLRSDQYSQDSLNHLRTKQERDGAQLPKQQMVEVQELNGKKERALRARGELEAREVVELGEVIRRRRDASCARGNLRLEVWRRKVEGDVVIDNIGAGGAVMGTGPRKLPGDLPYLRSEEVFDSFWMVPVPFKSVLDEVLPWSGMASAASPVPVGIVREEEEREGGVRLPVVMMQAQVC